LQKTVFELVVGLRNDLVKKQSTKSKKKLAILKMAAACRICELWVEIA
jgi:hypothetical protein